MGYKGIHCVHGFRATAKTILQEQLKFPLIVVEMALGHITKDPNGTAYGRFEFIDDRDVMMQTWADYLDALKQGKDTSSFKHGTNIDPYQQLNQLVALIGKDRILDLIS